MTETIIRTSPIRTMIPIIKIVGDSCNLRCDYCFYHCKNQSNHHLMNDELLEKFIAQYMELFSSHLFFIWHGGEPMLAGLPFFRRILDFQTKYHREKQTIKNAIQTNATLVTDEWAEFFKINDFKVGVSLDGGKISHDYFRKNKEGKGSFERALKGIKILLRHGIQPGIIQTLTNANTVRVKIDFDFFANILDLKRWGVNEFLDIEGMNKAMLGQSITNEKLTNFLKDCIDLWLTQNDPNLQMREIENSIAGLLKKKASSCKFNGCCTNYFCLDYDGKIYPCDRFSNRPEFAWGDLSEQSLLDILNSPARLKYTEGANSLHPDCTVCEWQNACHNGCTGHRVGGISGKYYYCETRKDVFNYLKRKLKDHKESLTRQ